MTPSPLSHPQLYLRELLRLTQQRFYQHLVSLGEDGLQMLFCHRWLLLCFKREFPEAEALRIWEACWAHYQVSGAGAVLVGREGQGIPPKPPLLCGLAPPQSTHSPHQPLTLRATIFQAHAAGFRPHLPCN